MHTNLYNHMLTQANTHAAECEEVLQTYSPARAIWEVDGTLWQVSHCDVTAMTSNGCLSFTLLFGFDDFC